MDYAAMSVGNMADEHRAEGPLPQIVAGSIEELLARGSERGYVTYDELRNARSLSRSVVSVGTSKLVICLPSTT